MRILSCELVIVLLKPLIVLVERFEEEDGHKAPNSKGGPRQSTGLCPCTVRKETVIRTSGIFPPISIETHLKHRSWREKIGRTSRPRGNRAKAPCGESPSSPCALRETLRCVAPALKPSAHGKHAGSTLPGFSFCSDRSSVDDGSLSNLTSPRVAWMAMRRTPRGGSYTPQEIRAQTVLGKGQWQLAVCCSRPSRPLACGVRVHWHDHASHKTCHSPRAPSIIPSRNGVATNTVEALYFAGSRRPTQGPKPRLGSTVFDWSKARKKETASANFLTMFVSVCQQLAVLRIYSQAP